MPLIRKAHQGTPARDVEPQGHADSKFKLGIPAKKFEDSGPECRLGASNLEYLLISAGGLMETLRKKSFWGAMVFVAVFVTSIVVLLSDNAMAR